MSDKMIQDIYVVKKSIRMIKKSDISDNSLTKKKNKTSSKETHSEEEKNSDLVDKFPLPKKTKINNADYTENKESVTKNSLMFLWGVCILSVIVLLFLLSSVFATATLSITPKSEIVTLNDTYKIVSDKNSSTSTLHYEVMTITKTLSKNLETDGEEYVERKATGKAIIYNNSGPSNQRLINNTRLETKDGLVYRIRQSVDVPGVKTISGVKTPGSVEVEIIADMPGEKYNMKLSDLKGDFTIPGFKGSTKYNTFYARLSADTTGGLIGSVEKVSDEKISLGRLSLKDTLKSDLIKEVFSKKPDQYILFKDNYYIQCTDLADESEVKSYKISEECSIHAIIFNKEELATYLAKNKIKNLDNSKVDILWDDNNQVSIIGSTEKPWNETSLKARFAGQTQFVWSYDANKILDSIIDQDKSVIASVITDNKNSIVEIQANIKPMWKNTFPKSKKSIRVIDTVRDAVK